MKVEFAYLPRWHGGLLAAEYDRTCDTARVNVDAVARVRDALGECEARAFVACAVAHERYHRDHPGASEADAHRYARATCGADPARFEAVLRG